MKRSSIETLAVVAGAAVIGVSLSRHFFHGFVSGTLGVYKDYLAGGYFLPSYALTKYYAGSSSATALVVSYAELNYYLDFAIALGVFLGVVYVSCLALIDQNASTQEDPKPKFDLLYFIPVKWRLAAFLFAMIIYLQHSLGDLSMYYELALQGSMSHKEFDRLLSLCRMICTAIFVTPVIFSYIIRRQH